MIDFLTGTVLVLLWLGSITVGVIAAAALVTYMRRTWQLIRADEHGSIHEQILDGIDRIETRLQAMSERLASVEEREGLGPGDEERGDPPR